jgi:hypothetical protein
MAATVVGLLAAVDRVIRLDPLLHVLALTSPFTSAAFSYTKILEMRNRGRRQI